MPELLLARGNYLRPNGHGGYLIRQSDLSAWSRCQLQKWHYDHANANPEATQPEILSATSFGSVVHHIFMNMELWRHEGMDADEIARQGLRLWEHYWDPANIATLPGNVRWPTVWIARQTYMGLKARGREVIKNWAEILKDDRSHVLALEYQFAVPVEIAGRLHTLTGTVDQLTIKTISGRKPHLSIRDWKSGKKPTYLRWNNQGTTYAYATTTPEFWNGWAGSGMQELETFSPDVMEQMEHVFSSHGYSLHSGDQAFAEGKPLASRRFYWGDLNEGKFSDGGWRVQQDYDRMKHAIDSYVRACEAEAYGVNLDCSVCMFCPFKSSCAGVGLPSPTEGAP